MGELPLAQLALAGVTGFVLVRLMSDGAPDPAGRFPFPGWLMAFALPVAVAAAVVVGLLVALPAVRGRGVELSVVTLAAAVALERWYFDSPALTGVGARTTAPLPASSPGGLELANTGGDRFAFSALAIAALLVCALAVVNLRRGETGRRFLAVRANAGAAAASGVDVARTRLVAVGVASALAGVAGGLFALQRGEVGAADWTLGAGLVLLAFAAIGGITSVAGALLGGLLTAGGLVMAFATLHIDTLGQHITALAGLGLVAVTVLRPAGLAALLQPSCSHMATCLVTWRGPEWIRAALRYGPWLVVGAGAGWLVWTRHEGFSWWMLLLGALLGLAVRQLLEAAVRRRRPAAVPRAGRRRRLDRSAAAWPPPCAVSTNGSNGTNGANGATHAGNGAVAHAANGAHAGLSVPRPRAYLPRPALPLPLPGGRALLRVTELTVGFGGVQALTDLDLTVDEGTVAGLVGPNGAGKTVFVDAVTGALRPDAGGIELDGRAIGRLSTAARARRGLVRTFADGELFDDLTVRDNLMVAAQRPRWWSFLADMVWPGRRSRAVEDQADWAIGALGLERLADEVAADLTHSKRKLVAIARAFAARPKLLVLDEPASGLDHADRQLLRAAPAGPARSGHHGPARRPRPRSGPRRLRHRPRARPRRGHRLRTARGGEHERRGAARLPRLERAPGAAGAAVAHREGAAAPDDRGPRPVDRAPVGGRRPMCVGGLPSARLPLCRTSDATRRWTTTRSRPRCWPTRSRPTAGCGPSALCTTSPTSSPTSTRCPATTTCSTGCATSRPGRASTARAPATRCRAACSTILPVTRCFGA